MPVAGGTTRKLSKRRLPPLEELVPLAIAIELEAAVDRKRHARVERIDLHRVIDHEIARHERIDLRRVASEGDHRIAHRGEIDHARDAREVLQDHPPRHERDLSLAHALGVEGGERLHVLLGDHPAVAVPEARLEQNLDPDRQPRDVAVLAKCVDSKDLAIAECGGEAFASRGERMGGHVAGILIGCGPRRATRVPALRARTERILRDLSIRMQPP